MYYLKKISTILWCTRWCQHNKIWRSGSWQRWSNPLNGMDRTTTQPGIAIFSFKVRWLAPAADKSQPSQDSQSSLDLFSGKVYRNLWISPQISPQIFHLFWETSGSQFHPNASFLEKSHVMIVNHGSYFLIMFWISRLKLKTWYHLVLVLRHPQHCWLLVPILHHCSCSNSFHSSWLNPNSYQFAPQIAHIFIEEFFDT